MSDLDDIGFVSERQQISLFRRHPIPLYTFDKIAELNKKFKYACFNGVKA